MTSQSRSIELRLRVALRRHPAKVCFYGPTLVSATHDPEERDISKIFFGGLVTDHTHKCKRIITPIFQP